MGAGWNVRVTGMEEAGRPRVVSRTWHVIGGLGDVIVEDGVEGCDANCDDNEEIRVVGEEAGMRC